MRTLLFTILILTCPLSWSQEKPAASDLPAQKELIKKLPGHLAKLEWKKQSPKDIEKEWGAAKEKESKDGFEYLFYSFDGIKYDTSVAFKDGKISHVIYVPGKTKWELKDFKDFIPASQVEDARKLAAAEKPSHGSGQGFAVENEKTGLAIFVSYNAKRSVNRVMLWQVGEPKP